MADETKPKHLVTKKSFWVPLIAAMLIAGVNSATEQEVVNAETAAGIMALLGWIVRLVTKTPARLVP